MKQKRLAIAGMTGALLLGAGTGVVLNLPSSAGASSSVVAAATTPTDPAAPADSGTGTPTGTDAHGPGKFLKDSLAALVTSGTITQAQADAITAAVDANRPTGGPGVGDGDGDHAGRGPGGPGMGRHGGRGGAGLDAAATALGMTPAELRTELESGKTIAQVATAKSVDVQKVIDALVAEATTRITDMVNGVKPAAPADQTAPADPAATPSSTATNG